jgi:hypothetical protein
VPIKIDIAGVIANILQVLPKTTNIVIVMGNSPRYRKMLSEMTHEPQRQTILQLLADEEAEETPSPSSIDE